MQPDMEQGKATVLFVEDDPAMLSLARMGLEAAGYVVLLAANGQEALTHYRRAHSDVDLAIVDLVLPDIRGTDLIGELLLIDDTVPILFATGLCMEEAQDAISAGALDLIHKPYSLTQLCDELDRFGPVSAENVG